MGGLADEARLRHGVTPPKRATLIRYGLTEDTWLALLKAQGWRCPICLRPARTVKLATDHHHVPRWKHLPPSERAEHVRGVLCLACNYRKVGNLTHPDEVQRIADYLRAHHQRRNGNAG